MATFQFKNATTGESINVTNISKVSDNEFFFTVRNAGCGTKFFNRNVCFANNGDKVYRDKNGTSLLLKEGWECLGTVTKGGEPKAPRAPKEPKAESAPRKERKPRAPKAKAAEDAPTPKEEPKSAPVPESTPTAAPKAATEKTDFAKKREEAKARLEEKYGKMGSDVFEEVAEYSGAKLDEATIAEIVARQIKAAKAGVTVHAVKINDGEIKELPNGMAPHPLLKKLLALVKNDRIIGRFPWLFGPAGSGKSTLCSQVAAAMGLPFYSVSSLQQKYELEGYTDAVGELVKTTFYEAAKNGGIFLFDEASTTSAEVNVAFNSMLANLWYNFPKEGMVKAHKDFHIIAADNTAGRGGSNAYHARFEMDASTLDRYVFVEVGYTDEHDLRMAQGDKELVSFIKAVRVALDKANLTYLATPRASKAIKALQTVLDDDKEALFLGLCSGWDKQDTRTVANAITGVNDNKYYKMFKAIAK